jgi:Fe-S-cluster-containing dehydrogenase component
MSLDRRTMLKGLAVAGAGAAAGEAIASESEAPKPPPDAVGMLYDSTRCIGCEACVWACKQANNMPGNLYDPPKDLSGDTKNIIKRYEAAEGEEYAFMKGQCMHCLDPGCASACMIGAFQKRDYGVVTWDGSRCIGCRYCQVACPYNIPKFQWDTPTPKIVKCELCLHRLKEGKEPGCCEACPVDAVIYGTYEELLADARQRVAEHPERYWPRGNPRIFGEHDGGGTQVLYLAGIEFEKLGLPDLGDDYPGAIARKVQHGVYQGFIAPAALFVAFGAAVWRSRRSQGGGEEES